MSRTAQRCEWLLPAALQMAELLIAQLAAREGHAPSASASMSAFGAGAAPSGASAPADARITMNRFASALATATQRVSRTFVHYSLFTLHSPRETKERALFPVFLYSYLSSTVPECKLAGWTVAPSGKAPSGSASIASAYASDAIRWGCCRRFYQ